MGIETVINKFCSLSPEEWEHTGNSKALEVAICSQNSHYSHPIQQDQQYRLFAFVKKSCLEFKIDPNAIINNFLSKEDEQDILNNHLSTHEFQKMVKSWIDVGMPAVSGKQLSAVNSITIGVL